MKTSRLKFYIYYFLVLSAQGARAYNAFECLRDLMPITDRGTFQNKREGVEEPFLLNDKFVVFPEVTAGLVTGFYFYGNKAAIYYDGVERNGKISGIVDLAFKKEDGVYEMVAQPSGLETVAVHYLPGFKLSPSGKTGPVVLGASVLPVVGAFVSRPDLSKVAYLNPKNVTESEVKRWMNDHWTGRRPSSIEDLPVINTIVRLKTVHTKDSEKLWAPLKQELKLRRTWIQSRNLDEKAFKQLTLTLEGSCKE